MRHLRAARADSNPFADIAALKLGQCFATRRPDSASISTEHRADMTARLQPHCGNSCMLVYRKTQCLGHQSWTSLIMISTIINLMLQRKGGHAWGGREMQRDAGQHGACQQLVTTRALWASTASLPPAS